MVAVTAPAPRMPRSASIHSRLVSPMTATRSPGRIPSAARPSDTSRARRASSAQDTSCQRPSRLRFSAAALPFVRTCRSTSAIRFGAAGAPAFTSACEIISPSFAAAYAAARPVQVSELFPRNVLPPSLLRRIVPPGYRGDRSLQLGAGQGGLVLLREEIREVDVGADVRGVLPERVVERLPGAVRGVLGPGELV